MTTDGEQGLRKHLWWPAQLGRTELFHHEEAYPDTVWTAAGRNRGKSTIAAVGAHVYDSYATRPPHDYK